MKKWLRRWLGLDEQLALLDAVHSDTVQLVPLLEQVHRDVLELRIMVAEVRTGMGLEPGIHPVETSDKLLELTSFDPMGI